MDDGKNTLGYHFQDNSDIEGTALSSARKQYDAGDYITAIKILKNILHQTTNSQVYVELGNSYFKLGDYREALDYWTKATNLNSKDAIAYSNIGNLYYKNREIDKAIPYWMVSLVIRPEDGDTCLNLAVAFNEKKMRSESIKYFEKYLKYTEDKSSIEYSDVKDKIQTCYEIANECLIEGVNHHSENNLKKAAGYYFKAIANYPNLSKANLNLGSIFFSEGDYQLALKYWKNAAHIDPKYDKIYSNIAIAHDMLSEFDYAYCYYDRYMNFLINNKEEYYKINTRKSKLKPYINKHPDLIENHVNFAQRHIESNEFYDAIDEFKNYAILNPSGKDKYKDLVAKLESYLNPEAPIIKYCFEMGNELLGRQNPTDAKPYFFRAMRLSSPQDLEFNKAKALYSRCEKLELGIF